MNIYCTVSEALVDSARALKLLVLHGCFLTIQGTHSLLYFQPLLTRRSWSKALPNKSVYFKQDVLAEPLFNQWYAWTNLIPPVSSAMYIANSHIKIMESFVAAPQAHISALKNPAMLGGPFINYDASKVDEIKQLLDRTKKEHAHMLELADAVKHLDTMLQNEATGLSLEPLYPKVPEILRGYVELVYDLHHRPSIRFIEGLLYKSRYYNPSSQSVALDQLDSDQRSFVFSTPRLKSNGHLFLNVPFNHEGLDELFKMRFVSRRYDEIKEVLPVDADDDERFSSFFTEASLHDLRGTRVMAFASDTSATLAF